MNQPIGTPNSDHEQWLWGRRCGAIFKVRLSVLYHLKRERFFDLVDKWSSMLTAASATAAVATLLKRAEVVDLAFAVAAAVLSLLPLVVNPAERARRHGQMAADFRRLRVDAERAGQRWTEEQCDAFDARVLELELTEPAALSALVIDCQNQLVEAAGNGARTHPLRWHEQMLKHVWDFDATSIMARSKAPGLIP